MRDLVVSLLIFGSFPYIIKKPYVGVLVWSWISYMNPHRLAYGFAYSMPFAAIVAATTLIAIPLSKEPKSIPKSPVIFVLVIFILWMGVTTLFAIFPESALIQYKKILKIQAVTFLTAMLIRTERQIALLVATIAVSIGFFGIKGGVFTILTGGGHRVWGPQGSFIEGNNEIAVALLMVIPLFNYLRYLLKGKWLKLVISVSMMLIGISAIGSQSRGAFLASIAMLSVLWWKSQKKFVTAMIAIVVALSVFAFMPESWHNRMKTINTYEQDHSAMGRINAWWAAFNIARDRITAGGFDHWSLQTFAIYAPDPTFYQDAHSIYFEVLGEHGFIGLALFLAIGGLSFINASWIVRHTKRFPELEWANMLARMIQVSLVSYATGGAFLGMAYFDLFYHLVIILVIVRSHVRQYETSTNNGEASEGGISPGRSVKSFVIVKK
jgi:putative inorganic carbon (HCO3(-)) transporter